MRIVCPTCGAAYELPVERLAVGRMVRCARCNGDWAPLVAEKPPQPAPEAEKPRLEERLPPPEPAVPVPEAAPPVAALVPPPFVAPPRQDRPALSGAPGKPAGRALALAWALSLTLLVVLVVAAVVRREAIMRAWPASERAYAAVGLRPVR